MLVEGTWQGSFKDWVARVSDFGESAVARVDETMSMVGSPLFVSPEVLLGLRYDGRADST